jgi:hypothetical protein
LDLLLSGQSSLRYLRGPWIEFEDENGRRWCQADGILLQAEAKTAIVYEIKYQHCLEAWWQLTWLYEPVVRKIYPEFAVGRMEICHWHDPAVTFPEGYDLTESPFSVPHRSRVAVCIFNPKRSRGIPQARYSHSEGGGTQPGSDRPQEASQRPYDFT